MYERVRHDMPNVSLKTVYQTLNDLADLGAISVLDVGTGSARFDPNVETTHHHLVCRSCGKVRDLAADFPGLQVPRRATQGFDVDSAEVVFRGLCDECKRIVSTSRSSSNSHRTRPQQKGQKSPCQH